MIEKTVVYESPDGVKTVRTEHLEYESNTDCWQFERDENDPEIIRIPRERIYEIRQQRAERKRDDRDRYGHP